MLHHAQHQKKDKANTKDEEKVSKDTIEFHKRFDVPRSESVITSFACAHKGKFLKQGKMFITQNYIGFHAQLFGKHHKKLVIFSDVADIAKEHYGMLPNAVKVTIIKNSKKKEMLFASFLHRDAAHDALVKQWRIVKDKASSAQNGSDSDDEHYSHVGDKKEIELKRLSPRSNESDKGNQYKNYDVTKKNFPPTSTAHEHDGAEKPSLADRAAALVDSGAIVSDENLKSRPTSQQVMVDGGATTTTIEVEAGAPKKLLCGCLPW